MKLIVNKCYLNIVSTISKSPGDAKTDLVMTKRHAPASKNNKIANRFISTAL